MNKMYQKLKMCYVKIDLEFTLVNYINSVVCIFGAFKCSKTLHICDVDGNKKGILQFIILGFNILKSYKELAKPHSL